MRKARTADCGVRTWVAGGLGLLAPAAQASRLTPQDAERAQRFIERGDSSLKEGDFSAARLFYQRAAMIASVSGVASTAPWPARAWSEWPCVISARATGRTGSMKKSPSGQ